MDTNDEDILDNIETRPNPYPQKKSFKITFDYFTVARFKVLLLLLSFLLIEFGYKLYFFNGGLALKGTIKSVSHVIGGVLIIGFVKLLAWAFGGIESRKKVKFSWVVYAMVAGIVVRIVIFWL